MNKIPRKPFKETKFAAWLKEHDSELFAFLADRWPDKKPIGKVIQAVFLALSKVTDEKKIEGVTMINED